MQDNKRHENKSAKPFRLPKNILRFVDDFFAANCEITPAQEKAFAETRRCLFEAIKRKRNDPDLVFFQTARELLDFFDLVESGASSITMYQRKKFRTAVTIYKELLIGERERHSNADKLACFKNPVLCSNVAKHKDGKDPERKRPSQRSDNVARKLRKSGYPVVKKGNRNYCEAEHAAVLWPYWKKQQLEE